MTFAHPLWLVTGIAVAALFLALAHRASRTAAAGALAYSNIDFFERAAGQRFDPALAIALACALALAAGGAALAGPQVVARVPVHGGAIVLCVDTSGSMQATDVAPTRAGAAGAAVRAFVDGVPDGTRLGIVAFSSGAGIVQPLTTDKDAVREAVGAIPPPNGGTAIGDALLTAARALPPGGKRAIVLITDGVNNAGSDPIDAARTIGAGGIEIDTVGIGTSQSGQLIPGTAEEATIDEDALRTIAASAHGAYALASDAGSLRGRLAALASSTTRERRRVDLSFPIALGGGLLLALATGGAMLAGRFP